MPQEKAMQAKKLLRALLSEESGQDLIEYALIAALIALGAIVAMGGLSSQIASEFNTIGNSL
jgi:pilus assembly protein Flp/PilA